MVAAESLGVDQGTRGTPAFGSSLGWQSFGGTGCTVVAPGRCARVRVVGRRLAFQSSFSYAWRVEVILKFRGRVVTIADVAFMRALISENPTASRRALSRLLCEAWNWVQPNGALRDMVCRGLMLACDRAGLLKLPVQKSFPANPLAGGRKTHRGRIVLGLRRGPGGHRVCGQAGRQPGNGRTTFSR